jgi:hypothetical protein
MMPISLNNNILAVLMYLICSFDVGINFGSAVAVATSSW